MNLSVHPLNITRSPALVGGGGKSSGFNKLRSVEVLSILGQLSSISAVALLKVAVVFLVIFHVRNVFLKLQAFNKLLQ